MESSPVDSSAHSPQPPRSLGRGVLLLVVMGAVAMLLVVSLMLPYKLYQHDIQTAERNAEYTSALVSSALKPLLLTEMQDNDRTHFRGLVEALQDNQDFTFRTFRAAPVAAQFGDLSAQQADAAVATVFDSARAVKRYPTDTLLRHITPLVATGACGQCHLAADGSPIPPGTVLGAYEVQMELSGVKARSIRLIAEVGGFLLLASVLFGALLFWIINSNVLDPIRQLTYVLSGWDQGDWERPLPTVRSRELQELTQLIAARGKAEQRAPPR